MSVLSGLAGILGMTYTSGHIIVWSDVYVELHVGSGLGRSRCCHQRGSWEICLVKMLHPNPGFSGAHRNQKLVLKPLPEGWVGGLTPDAQVVGLESSQAWTNLCVCHPEHALLGEDKNLVPNWAHDSC